MHSAFEFAVEVQGLSWIKEQIQAEGLVSRCLDHQLLPLYTLEVVGALANAGVGQSPLPIHVLRTRKELYGVAARPLVFRVIEIGHVLRHVYVNAPNLVHQIDKVPEVQDHVVIDGDTEIMLDGVLDQACPPAVVPVVDEFARLPNNVNTIHIVAA